MALVARCITTLQLRVLSTYSAEKFCWFIFTTHRTSKRVLAQTQYLYLYCKKCWIHKLSLSCLLEHSIVTAILPRIWREAHVVPAYSEGDFSDTLNNRSVSQISNCCNVMEQIVSQTHMFVLISDRLKTASQFVFLNHKSTVK